MSRGSENHWFIEFLLVGMILIFYYYDSCDHHSGDTAGQEYAAARGRGRGIHSYSGSCPVWSRPSLFDVQAGLPR